jgi:hypothetical protein
MITHLILSSCKPCASHRLAPNGPIIDIRVSFSIADIADQYRTIKCGRVARRSWMTACLSRRAPLVGVHRLGDVISSAAKMSIRDCARLPRVVRPPPAVGVCARCPNPPRPRMYDTTPWEWRSLRSVASCRKRRYVCTQVCAVRPLPPT